MNPSHLSNNESNQPHNASRKLPLSVAKTLHRLAHGKHVKDAQFIALAREMIVPAVHKTALRHLGQIESQPQREYRWPFHANPLVNIAVGIVAESLFCKSQGTGQTTWSKAWTAAETVKNAEEPRKVNDAVAYIFTAARNALNAELKKASPSAALYDAVRAALGNTTGFTSVPENGRDLYAPAHGTRWPAAAESLDARAVARCLGVRILHGRCIPKRSEIVTVIHAAFNLLPQRLEVKQLTAIVAASFNLGNLNAVSIRRDSDEEDAEGAGELEMTEAWTSLHGADSSDDECEPRIAPEILLRRFESWWKNQEGRLPIDAMHKPKKGSAANALRCLLAYLSGNSIKDIAHLAHCGVSTLQEQCVLRGWSPQCLEAARAKWQRTHRNERFPAAGLLGRLNGLLGPLMETHPDEAIAALQLMQREYAEFLPAPARAA